MNINKNLTTTNYTEKNDVSRIKYIVVHYTGNNGDTAEANTNYFKDEYRSASAHYFVDETEIWQCVEDGDVAWHCGGPLQGDTHHTYHKICTNNNSIGIELCSRKDNNGNYYFEEDTIANAIVLIKELMSKYNIPIDNVIRHLDVTGKVCPAPFYDDNVWQQFKSKITIPKKLETINDIAWELGNRGLAKEIPYWMKRMEEDQNIYWLCNKIVNYILFYCGPQHEGQQLQTQNDVLWELNHRGIISNTKLWKSKFALEPNNTFILAKNAANYILTH